MSRAAVVAFAHHPTFTDTNSTVWPIGQGGALLYATVMKAIVLPIARPVSDVHAPLRRSLPAGAPTRKRAWATALLALAGLVLFVDIEFGLAYLLYFAARLAG